MTACQQASSGGFFAPAVIGAVIALVATLAGAILVERFASARERRTQEREWGRRLFDKYADAYRDFLASWGGSANAEILERTFGELRSKALVPGSILRQYQQSLAGLRGSSDAGEREHHARRLQAKIETTLDDPAGLAGE